MSAPSTPTARAPVFQAHIASAFLSVLAAGKQGSLYTLAETALREQGSSKRRVVWNFGSLSGRWSPSQTAPKT